MMSGHRELEVELRPAAPLAGLQHDPPALDLDDRRVRLAVAMDEELDRDRDRLLEQAVLPARRSRPVAVSFSKVKLDPPAAAFVERVSAGVLGEVLIGAIGAQHVGRAHAADAAVVAVVRRAGRVVGRQVVERRGDSRGVEVVPERSPLPAQHGLGRLVVERPEVELEPVVAHLPAPLAGDGLGGRVERGALLLRDGGG